MKDGWMKNDEGWMKNDEGWWFQAVEGFWWVVDDEQAPTTGCPKKKLTLGNQHNYWTNDHSEDYICSDMCK